MVSTKMYFMRLFQILHNCLFSVDYRVISGETPMNSEVSA